MTTTTILPEVLQIEIDDALAQVEETLTMASSVIANGCTTEEAHQLHLKIVDAHQYLEGLSVARKIYQCYEGDGIPDLLTIEICDTEESLREAEMELAFSFTDETRRIAEVKCVGSHQYLEGLMVVKGIYDSLDTEPTALKVVPTNSLEFANAA